MIKWTVSFYNPVQAEYDFHEIKRAMMHPAEVLGEKQVISYRQSG